MPRSMTAAVPIPNEIRFSDVLTKTAPRRSVLRATTTVEASPTDTVAGAEAFCPNRALTSSATQPSPARGGGDRGHPVRFGAQVLQEGIGHATRRRVGDFRWLQGGP